MIRVWLKDKRDRTFVQGNQQKHHAFLDKVRVGVFIALAVVRYKNSVALEGDRVRWPPILVNGLIPCSKEPLRRTRVVCSTSSAGQSKRRTHEKDLDGAIEGGHRGLTPKLSRAA